MLYTDDQKGSVAEYGYIELSTKRKCHLLAIVIRNRVQTRHPFREREPSRDLSFMPGLSGEGEIEPHMQCRCNGFGKGSVLLTSRTNLTGKEEAYEIHKKLQS